MSDFTGLTYFEGLLKLSEKMWEPISSAMTLTMTPSGYEAFYTHAAYYTGRQTVPWYTMHPEPRPITNSYIRGLPGNASLIQGGTSNWITEVWYERQDLTWRRSNMNVIADTSTMYLHDIPNWIAGTFAKDEYVDLFPTINEEVVRNARFGGRVNLESSSYDAWEYYFPGETYSVSGLFSTIEWHRLLPTKTTYFDDVSKIMSSLTWQIQARYLPDAQGRYRKTYDVVNIREQQ